MTGPATTPYDEVPYPDRIHPATHPDLLAVVATLFGMSPAPPERSRVLELGCAGGGNLISLAEILPGSRFVGIDLSPRQLAASRQKVRALGLTNVELHAMDILDVGEAFGRFDYILCHGVYSWVPADIRDKILAVCAGNLMPQGIAYVSYNCYPGWHARGAAREMMSYRVRHFEDPGDRVRKAREFLDFLARSVRDPLSGLGRILADEAELLDGLPDDYVLHEHLGEVNHPVYFHQFVDHAAAQGLQYLWESYVGELGGDLRPEVIQAVRGLASDLIEQQQYIDFLTDRRFRSSLLCHQGIALDRSISPERMKAFHIVGVALPCAASPDIGSTASEVFQTSEGAGMATNNPVFKAALTCLAERAPAALTFGELCAATHDRMAATAVARPVPDDQVPGFVADLLRRGALGRLVELHISRPNPAHSAPEGPVAEPGIEPPSDVPGGGALSNQPVGRSGPGYALR
jgi:SAM-dependent methyltransferase